MSPKHQKNKKRKTSFSRSSFSSNLSKKSKKHNNYIKDSTLSPSISPPDSPVYSTLNDDVSPKPPSASLSPIVLSAEPSFSTAPKVKSLINVLSPRGPADSAVISPRGRKTTKSGYFSDNRHDMNSKNMNSKKKSLKPRKKKVKKLKLTLEQNMKHNRKKKLVKQGSVTPDITKSHHHNYKKIKKRRKRRDRANSVNSSMVNNEYMIETENGFEFVNDNNF